jgi:hypothetical protein
MSVGKYKVYKKNFLLKILVFTLIIGPKIISTGTQTFMIYSKYFCENYNLHKKEVNVQNQGFKNSFSNH